MRKTKKHKRHNKRLSRISKSMINDANAAIALPFRYVYTSKIGVVIIPNANKVRARALARLIHNRQMKQRFYIKAFLAGNKIIEQHATIEPPKFTIYKGGEKWQ